MGAIQAWVPEGANLVGFGAFLGAVILAFLAGYLVGRGGRPREAPSPAAHRPGRPPSRDGDQAAPAPTLRDEEARLMDLTALRDEEAEPPRPLDLGPPPRR